MITEFDISKVELQCNIGENSGMNDHFDIGSVFEIGKFDIKRLTCILILNQNICYGYPKEPSQ